MYTIGDSDSLKLARKYFAQALKLNPASTRALYVPLGRTPATPAPSPIALFSLWSPTPSAKEMCPEKQSYSGLALAPTTAFPTRVARLQVRPVFSG